MDVGEMTVTQEDVQVVAKPRRRTYPAEYKRRILKEADACTAPGAHYRATADSEPRGLRGRATA